MVVSGAVSQLLNILGKQPYYEGLCYRHHHHVLQDSIGSEHNIIMTLTQLNHFRYLHTCVGGIMVVEPMLLICCGCGVNC